MTEQTTEAPEAPFEAPEDAAEDVATGYAIYDRTLGQYVGPVKRDGKPSASDARKAVGEGHVHAIVRV